MNDARAFALLDDGSGNDTASRLYRGLRRAHACHDPRELPQVWAAAAADLARGCHLVLLADYEWGARLLGIAADDERAQLGALTLLAFERCERLAGAAVDAWLQSAADVAAAPAGLLDLHPSVTRAEYAAAIARIHQYIADGETYQVNYTYRLTGQAYGDPLTLYRRLRQRQPVAFGALIRLPQDGDAGGAQDRWVLSRSPELFVAHAGGRLHARPMKGTAPRRADAAADRAQAQWLAADPKNRAENLMIVDLIRNDLGRLAQIGTVRVPRMFEVESYATVHQMTSTVEARLRADADFPAVLRALFPCGSITGAPKIQTMKRIAELESTPRGIYTGAIGWIEPAVDAAQRCPDFCLSVAIRTLTLGPAQGGLRPATLGVGGGIVIDSQTGSEYEETRTKARFARGFDPGLALIETMRAEAGAVPLLARHLARLAASAQALGFDCDAAAVARQVEDHARTLPAAAQRLRLQLAHDGSIALRSAPLPALAGPVTLLLAERPLPAAEAALAAHKTTLRASYDRALAAAEACGAFDMLFFDAAGQLTEGARSSVFVRIGGRWRTPPLGGALLPGVMRGVLLAELDAVERPIRRAELLAAREIIVCNALRGALPARLAAGVAAAGARQLPVVR